LQLGGDVWEIAGNITLESQRNHNQIHWFIIATKVALESATKMASKITCGNRPL